jgi:hypothetical protein
MNKHSSLLHFIFSCQIQRFVEKTAGETEDKEMNLKTDKDNVSSIEQIRKREREKRQREREKRQRERETSKKKRRKETLAGLRRR